MNPNTSKQRSRKTNHLRKGRRSIPHARYFLTLTTKDHKKGLTHSDIPDKIIEAWREMHLAKDFELHCGTVMPDHIHMLITLGERISLSQAVAKFKNFTTLRLRESHLNWQNNYFDHWLHPDELKAPFIRYIFLNPYRKELISTNETWPAWRLNDNERPELLGQLRDNKYPQAEWLSEQPDLANLIG